MVRLSRESRSLVLLLMYLASLGVEFASAASPVDRVVVLMLENRSFDAMLGLLKAKNPSINGITGRESLPMSTSDKNSKRVNVRSDAPYVSRMDPSHKLDATTYKIFGGFTPKDPAPMDGFLDWELHAHFQPLVNATEVLSCFEPHRLPVMATLAQEFVLLDDYYSSVPGPTYPNRMYALTATSHGAVENNPPPSGWPQSTIIEQLELVNRTWGLYYHDYAIALSLAKLRTKERMLNVRKIEDFYDAAKAGTLPHFSFLEPRYSPDANHPEKVDEPANDQHPDNDVALGEQLIKDIYEALRQGPLWNRTLLVITYDEHGGYWDHVPPPQGVPHPDDISPNQPVVAFNFTRLGVRVPTLLISPWVAKGRVEHAPSHPFASSRYEHSSIPATLHRLFGTPSFLTRRDAWAAPFDHLVDLKEPRTDCPWTLPNAPPPTMTAADHVASLHAPINDLQCDLLRTLIGAPEHACKLTKFEARQLMRNLWSDMVTKLRR